MRRLKIGQNKLLFVLAGCLMSSVAVASPPHCYAPSIELQELGSDYYDLERALKLSSQQERALNKLYKVFKGKWRGRLVESDCLGPDSAPRRQITNFDAMVSIQVPSDGLRLSIKKKNQSAGIEKSDKIDLLREEKFFQLAIGKHKVSSTEKLRFRNRLLEYVSTLERTGDKLQIDITLYINGIFVQHQLFTLAEK